MIKAGRWYLYRSESGVQRHREKSVGERCYIAIVAGNCHQSGRILAVQKAAAVKALCTELASCGLYYGIGLKSVVT